MEDKIRVMIVAAPYHAIVRDDMIKAAREVCENDSAVELVDVADNLNLKVPGALELSDFISAVDDTALECDAYIALGATDDDAVGIGAITSLATLAAELGTPIGIGVRIREFDKDRDTMNGEELISVAREAAYASIQMARIHRKLGEYPPAPNV